MDECVGAEECLVIQLLALFRVLDPTVKFFIESSNFLVEYKWGTKALFSEHKVHCLVQHKDCLLLVHITFFVFSALPKKGTWQ